MSAKPISFRIIPSLSELLSYLVLELFLFLDFLTKSYAKALIFYVEEF